MQHSNTNNTSELLLVDFQTHTILYDDKGIRAVSKKDLKGSDMELNCRALDSLLKFVKFHGTELDSQSANSLILLADRIDKMPFSEELHRKVKKVVHEVLVNHLENSNQPVSNVLALLAHDPVLNVWKHRFEKELVSRDGGFILMDDTLYIKPNALGIDDKTNPKEKEKEFSPQTDEKFKTILHNLLSEEPKINAIRFEKGFIVPRSDVEIMLTSDVPFNRFLSTYFVGTDPTKPILLHPSFIVRSEYLMGALRYNQNQARPRNLIEIPDIQLETIIKLNKGAQEGFKSLYINDSSYQELMEVVSYLEMQEIKRELKFKADRNKYF